MVKLAQKGIAEAIQDDAALATGVNTYKGSVTYPGVAEAFDLGYVPLDTLF
jgi:alanine dehydrogenase